MPRESVRQRRQSKAAFGKHGAGATEWREGIREDEEENKHTQTPLFMKYIQKTYIYILNLWMFSMFHPVFVFQGFFVWIGDVRTHHWGNTGTWTATLSKTVLGAGRGEAVLITLQGDWLVQVQHPWPIQWDWHNYLHLGGGFKYLLFSSLFGEMIQFDYISDGLKPPTSTCFDWFALMVNVKVDIFWLILNMIQPIRQGPAKLESHVLDLLGDRAKSVGFFSDPIWYNGHISTCPNKHNNPTIRAKNDGLNLQQGC